MDILQHDLFLGTNSSPQQQRDKSAKTSALKAKETTEEKQGEKGEDEEGAGADGESGHSNEDPAAEAAEGGGSEHISEGTKTSTEESTAKSEKAPRKESGPTKSNRETSLMKEAEGVGSKRFDLAVHIFEFFHGFDPDWEFRAFVSKGIRTGKIPQCARIN